MDELLRWLLLFALLWVGKIWLEARFARQRQSAVSPAGGRGSQPASYDADYAIEVVGESNYQKAIRAACGKGEVRHECAAQLELEDDNPYDDKAVRVWIDGGTVGYLSRSDARAYRRALGKGGKPAKGYPALIVGGGSGRSLGVWLDVPEIG